MRIFLILTLLTSLAACDDRYYDGRGRHDGHTSVRVDHDGSVEYREDGGKHKGKCPPGHHMKGEC